tara:strand:- start:168 stop:557 length:390 start_codon:yes stop_codon:yes gene_type:complete
MKSFNKITNPVKFKIFLSLSIIFSFMNNSTVLGSEKKSTLLKGISSDNQFEEYYFKNSIHYSEYDNSESQLQIFFGRWKYPNQSEHIFYPDLSIINTSDSIREIYKSKLNDMTINEINIMTTNDPFKNK